MTHQCCAACRLRLSPASGAEACPRCAGPLAVFAADQLVGYQLWGPADAPVALPEAASQAVAPQRSP